MTRIGARRRSTVAMNRLAVSGDGRENGIIEHPLVKIGRSDGNGTDYMEK